MKRGLVVLWACAHGVGAAVSAEPLGRLFFTPEQRALLERQRQTGSAQSTPALTDESVRLDGMLTRSDGPTTVWLNGRQLPEAHAAGIRAAAHGRATTATVSGRPADVRVGETLDPVTGARRDLVDPDSIRAVGAGLPRR